MKETAISGRVSIQAILTGTGSSLDNSRGGSAECTKGAKHAVFKH